MLAHNDDTIVSELGLGADIRAIRKSRGFTLQEFADKIDRSIGFVSQIERDISGISVEDLRKIAQVLEVPVSWFFKTTETPENERGRIVRRSNRKPLGDPKQGFLEELLSPDLAGSFEMFLSKFSPGTELKEQVFRKTEEAGYIIQGELEMTISGQTYQLKTGDSFRFKEEPYLWRNTHPTQEAQVLWVVSPPIY